MFIPCQAANEYGKIFNSDFAFHLVFPVSAVPFASGLPDMTSLMHMCTEIHQLERSFLDLCVLPLIRWGGRASSPSSVQQGCDSVAH